MHPGALFRWVAIAAAIELSLAAAAVSAPIGEAASVVPASNYTRNGGERPLAIRDPLEQNDRIRTTAGGSTRVRFLDDTMLTIGPDSEVLLDEFVYDGNKAQKATIEVVRGAMRFVSGTSDRRAYEIKTPAATIGVRGTVVDIGFVNGRWSFNTVDGTITARLTSTGETRTFAAGQPGFSIGPAGFIPLNPGDAQQLWRRLDNAHLALAKANNSNPSAPQGAAAGNRDRNDGDVTGSVRGNNQGQGDGSRIGEVRDRINQIGGIPPAVMNIISTTGSTSPLSNLSIFADLNAIMLASQVVLGPLGPGPAFTADPLGINAVGGDNSNIPISPVGEQLNRLLLDLSTVKWDGDANKAVRGGILSGTNPVGNDPNALALGRITATVAELHTDPSVDPLYQIGRWTNGVVGYSQNGGPSGVFAMNANQGLHYIVFGHTNGLYDINNQFQIAKTVTYSLEHATKPTWIDGRSAPGTFNGTLAVAFGTLAVSYGLQGTVAMTEGTASFGTQGGIANPGLSGAVASALGGIGKRNEVMLTSTDITGGACPNCLGFVEFVPVAKDKVGVFYFVDVGLNASIEGAAVFGSPGTPANSAPAGRPLVAVVDAPAGLHVNAATDGLAEIAGSNVLIKSISDGTYSRTRSTALSVETGTFGSIGWERWAAGDYADQSSQTYTIPTDGGLHMIHGTPGTIPAGFSNALKVQYSLAGGTSPTIADGSVQPGALGAGSKMAVDFSVSKIGLDLFINSLGAASFHVQTSGGGAALTTPASSEISFDSGGIITGANIPVLVTTGLPSCTSGNCAAAVAGFLAGQEVSEAALVYSLRDSNLVPAISGAAVFGRDLPVSNVGIFGYADPVSAAGNHIVKGPTRDFTGSPQNSIDQAIVADNTTVTGLSVQSFNLEVDASVNGWHRLSGRISPDGSSVDQGVIAKVLGWERLIGTLHQHTNSGGSPDMVLTANQGVHIIHGVAATNIPTSATYTYNLAGGTKPTIADGSVAAGTLTSGQVGVNFATAAPKFGVDLNVNMGAAGSYNLASAGGAAAPSIAAPNLHALGTFGTTATNQVVATNTSGPNDVCGSGTCSAAVSGFLAGDQAKHLGILYQFGKASAPGKVVTGAAGFSR